jgi:hypothetical protein
MMAGGVHEMRSLQRVKTKEGMEVKIAKSLEGRRYRFIARCSHFSRLPTEFAMWSYTAAPLLYRRSEHFTILPEPHLKRKWAIYSKLLRKATLNWSRSSSEKGLICNKGIWYVETTMFHLL